MSNRDSLKLSSIQEDILYRAEKNHVPDYNKRHLCPQFEAGRKVIRREI